MNPFVWMADDPLRYAVLRDALLATLAAVAVWGSVSRWADERLSRRAWTAAFFALAAAALFAARWPTLFVRDPLNQDEAQALAQAITALHDPVPWLGFDGNTCGPLNTYVLMLPALLGLHLTFLGARVVALALELGAIGSLYACAALCFDAALARVAILPPIAFFALAREDHFVHYSGEHLSIFLGMLALALLCVAIRQHGATRFLFLTGVAAGMMPFAKLQSLPLAGLTVAAAAAGIVAASPDGIRGRVLRLGGLGAGLMVAPVLILSWAAVGGSLHDFWVSYILTSRAYILYRYEPLSFLTATPGFGRLFDTLLAVAALGAVVLAVSYRRISSLGRAAFAGSLVVLAGAVWAIEAPRRGSLNYLLFAVLPAATAAAAGLGLAFAGLRARRPGSARGAITIAFVLATVAAAYPLGSGSYPYLGSVGDYFYGATDPVSALIAAHVHPGERLAIWGWRPKYFVTTQTLLGTRDAISQYQYSENYNPYVGYFRDRYVGDLERLRPRGFLDAGSDSFDFDGKGRFGYETFPELARIIDRDYRLAGRANGIRLFVRRVL